MKPITIDVEDKDAPVLQEFLDEVPQSGKYWAIMFGVLLYQKLQSCSYPLSRADGNKLLDHIEDLYQHMAEEEKEETINEVKNLEGHETGQEFLLIEKNLTYQMLLDIINSNQGATGSQGATETTGATGPQGTELNTFHTISSLDPSQIDNNQEMK